MEKKKFGYYRHSDAPMRFCTMLPSVVQLQQCPQLQMSGKGIKQWHQHTRALFHQLSSSLFVFPASLPRC